ncbi:1-alkyl-2-acetylglycerophosphocholine esterase [Durusdinium trenchii]|uniref:1-alkyl-2-acetylglycerophosphocholine esterase n=1 Tax=Durusdinium trenchii TaxID=1381693 RepID=A0ABP0QXR9_9DINO
MAYFRQQPGNGLCVEDPSTPPRPVNPSSSLKMTPPDNTELLAWRGSTPSEEAGHDPSSGETYAEDPPQKNLTFATYVNNTNVEHSCYHHSVKGKKRRGLLIDPGAAAGLVGSETLRDLIESCYPEDGKNMVTWSESTATITGISGCPDKALGRVHLRLPFKGLKAVYEADVIGNEGSLCPALGGNPALCAMKASLHSSWFENQDGLLVTWDTQSQNTPVMYAFRVLLTDSGHYLLPLDEDTSLKSQDLQICHFIKELSEVSHRQWPDHAYTFWQSATRTAIPEQKRSCLERTYHSIPFEVEPKDPRATAQQTSCSTTPEAEIKNHDSLTSCSTTVEEKIKDQGIDTSCSASPEAEIHDHSVNTSCSTSPEAEIHDHSMNTSCSTIPEETFNDHGKDTSCSTTTDVFLADALIDLPLYTGDLLPNCLTPEEQKKLTKDYKAMPEEFYTHTNRRMVTPSSFPKWFSEAKKKKTKWHVWEWCSGSSRLSLTCCLAGLIVGFPVDFRYGWDIGNPEHQKMLGMALSTFEPEILMASPRCKFWSISASRRDRHLLLQDREAERPALTYMQQTMSYQVSSGRAYVLEQPWTSAMWSESVMAKAPLLASAVWTQFFPVEKAEAVLGSVVILPVFTMDAFGRIGVAVHQRHGQILVVPSVQQLESFLDAQTLGEKGSVPLNFLHILVGRDAFTSVTERSDRVTGGISAVEDRTLFYNTDGELKKAPPFGTFGQVLRALKECQEMFARKAELLKTARAPNGHDRAGVGEICVVRGPERMGANGREDYSIQSNDAKECQEQDHCWERLDNKKGTPADELLPFRVMTLAKNAYVIQEREWGWGEGCAICRSQLQALPQPPRYPRFGKFALDPDTEEPVTSADDE